MHERNLGVTHESSRKDSRKRSGIRFVRTPLHDKNLLPSFISFADKKVAEAKKGPSSRTKRATRRTVPLSYWDAA